MKDEGQEVERIVGCRADGKLMYAEKQRDGAFGTSKSHLTDILIFLIIIILLVGAALYLRQRS